MGIKPGFNWELVVVGVMLFTLPAVLGAATVHDVLWCWLR